MRTKPAPEPTLSHVRKMGRDGGISDRVWTYTLSPEDAVVMAYVADVHGTGELVPANERHVQHHADARALVKASTTRPDARHIILRDGRAWFAFPGEAPPA